MSRINSASGNTALRISRVASNRVYELWNLIKTSECHLSQSLNVMIPRSSADVYPIDKVKCFVNMCNGGIGPYIVLLAFNILVEAVESVLRRHQLVEVPHRRIDHVIRT